MRWLTELVINDLHDSAICHHPVRAVDFPIAVNDIHLVALRIQVFGEPPSSSHGVNAGRQQAYDFRHVLL